MSRERSPFNLRVETVPMEETEYAELLDLLAQAIRSRRQPQVSPVYKNHDSDLGSNPGSETTPTHQNQGEISNG